MQALGHTHRRMACALVSEEELPAAHMDGLPLEQQLGQMHMDQGSTPSMQAAVDASDPMDGPAQVT